MLALATRIGFSDPTASRSAHPPTKTATAGARSTLRTLSSKPLLAFWRGRGIVASRRMRQLNGPAPASARSANTSPQGCAARRADRPRTSHPRRESQGCEHGGYRTGGSRCVIEAAVRHQVRRPRLARLLNFEEARLPLDGDTHLVRARILPGRRPRPTRPPSATRNVICHERCAGDPPGDARCRRRTERGGTSAAHSASSSHRA